jgi:hypothetical protein
MKDLIAGVFASVLGIASFIALIFGLTFLGWVSYDYFAPKYRATDNKVFKESEQYNDGMIRDLESLQIEYLNADDAHKDALRAIVLHRFSVYPEEKMPYNLRNFYNQLRSGK